VFLVILINNNIKQ